MSLFNVKLKFKIVQFETSLAFQKVYMAENFIDEQCAVLSTVQTFKQYDATNGITIKIKNGVQDSIANVGTNLLILGDVPSNNMTYYAFGSTALREEYFLKIVSALKELGIYIDNNGTLPQVCKTCCNFINSRKRYCNYIIEADNAFDFETDSCSHYMLMHPSIVYSEIIVVK